MQLSYLEDLEKCCVEIVALIFSYRNNRMNTIIAAAGCLCVRVGEWRWDLVIWWLDELPIKTFHLLQNLLPDARWEQSVVGLVQVEKDPVGSGKTAAALPTAVHFRISFLPASLFNVLQIEAVVWNHCSLQNRVGVELGTQSWVISLNSMGLRTQPWGVPCVRGVDSRQTGWVHQPFSQGCLEAQRSWGLFLNSRTATCVGAVLLQVFPVQMESSGDDILSGAVGLVVVVTHGWSMKVMLAFPTPSSYFISIFKCLWFLWTDSSVPLL